MKRILHFLLLSLVPCLLLSACEKYEQVPENYPFRIRAEADAYGEGGATLVVTVSEGVYSGDCTLAVSVDGAPFGGVRTAEGEAVSSSTKWSFGEDGRAAFRLTGLSAGRHELTVAVTRWYHTATCMLNVVAN